MVTMTDDIAIANDDTKDGSRIEKETGKAFN